MRPALLLSIVVLAGVAAHAEDAGLGRRTAFDLGWTRNDDWQTAPSVTLTLDDGRLQLSNRGGAPGWAETRPAWFFDRDATLAVHVAELSNAQVTVQAEWLTEDGRFLSAANAVDRVNESDVRVEVKLDDLLPPSDQPRPAMMRLKLWIGGDGGRATISELAVHAPRRWRDEKTHLLAVVLPTATLQPDVGMIATLDRETITMRLEPEQPFAGLVVGDAIPFDPDAQVLFDLAWLAGGRASLQAVCFDDGGVYLASVGLMTEIQWPGAYELPLSIYRSAFPPGTKTIQFKLWLGGEGAFARVAGIWVGASR